MTEQDKQDITMKTLENDNDNMAVWGPGPVLLRDTILVSSSQQIEAPPPLSAMITSLPLLHGEELTAACEVLEICFQKLSIDVVTETVTKDIPLALKHPNSAVRLMGLNQIFRIMSINPATIEFPKNDMLGLLVVNCIADEDLKVGVKAMDIVTLGNWIQYEATQREFEKILNRNSSDRCKCYEVIVNIAKSSEGNTELCHRLGYLKKIIDELDTTDFLLQLNIIELLSNLSTVEHGLKYLIDNNVLTTLIDLAEDEKKNPFPTLYMPALMKFFGSIAYKFPNEVFSKFPKIVDYLFESIKSSDMSLLPPALDTLGFVGSTLEGKLMLCSLGTKIIEAVTQVGQHIKNSPSAIRVRALNCLENLICIKDKRNDSVLDNRASLLVREWFRAVSQEPSSINVIVSICKNPFPDLQLAALGVLHSICEHSWGQELIKDSPGLIEYLMNRSLGHEKESKHAKYNIISCLSKSPVFDTATLLKLKTYVQEGPFYVESITEVAIEGD